jgi:hypothetical protein
MPVEVASTVKILNRRGGLLGEFPGANVREALINANLKGAYLGGANLECANLESAYLEGANLEAAYLKGANLKGAYLEGANLKGAYLKGAYLKGAYLKGAYLEGAYLEGANLEGANLEGAYLEGANLEAANLEGANLEGANLKWSTWWQRYLSEVVPALLQAGGKSVEEVLAAGAWECHNWENCPMAVAFSVKSVSDIPLLYQPRAREFVRFFDAGLIPRPVVAKEEEHVDQV